MYYTPISFHLSLGSIFSSTFSNSVPFLPQSSLLNLGTPLLCHLLICLPLYIGTLSSSLLFFLAILTVAVLGFSTLMSPPEAVASPQLAFTSPVLTLLSIPFSNFALPVPAASLLVYLSHLSCLLRLFIIQCSFCPSQSSLSPCPAGSSLCSGCPRQMLSKPCFSPEPAEPWWIPGVQSHLPAQQYTATWGVQQADCDFFCSSTIKRNIYTKTVLLSDVT